MKEKNKQKELKEINRITLVAGKFRQCDSATLNYDGDPSLAYCAKYDKIMDGWTVSKYCRGEGGCDQ